MRVTVTAHKGGVAKTMTAIHLAAYFSERFGAGSTVLVDADPNASVVGWARRGSLPFEVVEAGPSAGEALGIFEHSVIDTQGRPRGQALERIVDGCDLLVVPTTPDSVALEALMMMVRDLQELGGRAEYRVLLTIVPPWPVRDGGRARAALEKRGVPLFSNEIHRRQVFSKAGAVGVPVYDVKDRRAAAGWGDYRKVGEELIEAKPGAGQ